jgi:threonine dehydrogenase-like Zn-dependent dehydrogenase
VPDEHPDERFLFLSDILPTAWQAVEFAEFPQDGTLAALGLGPVGQFCARIARHLGASRVIGVDSVPERLEMARRHGIETVDDTEGDVVERLLEMTGGRGPDGVVDAVGMEAARLAHGQSRPRGGRRAARRPCHTSAIAP